MKTYRSLVVLVLATVAAAALAAGNSDAASTPTVPAESMFIRNIDECPGFAPSGTFHVGYFGDVTGEFLRFDSVRAAGPMVFAVGDGVPPVPAEGFPLPTSAYDYRVIARITSLDFRGVDGRILIVRSDGSTVSGSIYIQTDSSHGFLLTSFTSQPTCRLH